MLDLILVASSICIVFTDVLWRKISNLTVVCILITCVLLALTDGHYSFNISQSLLVLVTGLALFYFGVLAAGDTKLLSTYVLIIDKEYFIFCIVMISFLGFITAIIIWSICRFRKVTDPTVPYGVPIVMSSLLCIYLSKLS
ncbi:A24 family peptidase [Grimontia kaedaensis]|uniref:A24 family peptidase n=1 Tax=Grimontia kaedaensis TaxID=2872157 RepID=UPI00336A61D4